MKKNFEKLKVFLKKNFLLSFIVLFIFSSASAFFASFNSNLISRSINLYAFTKELASSSDEYCFSHFLVSNEQKYEESKKELHRIDSNFDLMTRTGCVTFFASSHQNGDKLNYDIVFEGEELDFNTGVLSMDYYCYDLRSNGCYHGMPIKPYFDTDYFSSKGFYCDIRADYGKTRDAGSYITDKFADFLLKHKKLEDYESLLGKTYSISYQDTNRTYTINNIIKTTEVAGKSVQDYYGNFILTDDIRVFENNFCCSYIGINSDILLSFDLLSYFKQSENNLLSLKIKKQNSWIEDKACKNLEFDILNKNSNNLRFYEILLLILSCLLIVLSLFLSVKFGNCLSLKIILTFLVALLIILLTFNLVFLFFYEYTLLLQIFNFVFVIPFEVFFVYFLFLYFKKKKVFKTK